MDESFFDTLAVRAAKGSRRGVLIAVVGAVFGSGVAPAAARGDGTGRIGARCNTGHDCGRGLACEGKRCAYKRGCGGGGMTCRRDADCCTDGQVLTCRKGRCRSA